MRNIFDIVTYSRETRDRFLLVEDLLKMWLIERLLNLVNEKYGCCVKIQKIKNSDPKKAARKRRPFFIETMRN